MQRGTLAEKGLEPDILQMTATPIPRTLAITVYGGMDISVIDELPPGRTPVKTRRITPAKVADMYDYLRKQAARGLQTYIVCPLVEESSARDAKAVTKHYEELVSGPLNGLRVGLMHGRLASREKDAVMHAFKRGELDADQHERDRSGHRLSERNDHDHRRRFAVWADAVAPTARARRARQRGVALFLVGQGENGRRTQARRDHVRDDERVRHRGGRSRTARAGRISGVRQAGMGDLRVADLVRDARLLDAARREAEELLKVDPYLKKPETCGIGESGGAVCGGECVISLRARGFQLRRFFWPKWRVGKPALRSSSIRYECAHDKYVVWRIRGVTSGQSRAKIWAIRSRDALAWTAVHSPHAAMGRRAIRARGTERASKCRWSPFR